MLDNKLILHVHSLQLYRKFRILIYECSRNEFFRPVLHT